MSGEATTTIEQAIPAKPRSSWGARSIASLLIFIIAAVEAAARKVAKDFPKVSFLLSQPTQPSWMILLHKNSSNSACHASA